MNPIQTCDECHHPVRFARADPNAPGVVVPGDYFVTAIRRLGGGYGKAYGWQCVYVHLGACEATWMVRHKVTAADARRAVEDVP
jgi:hypothetical protein